MAFEDEVKGGESILLDAFLAAEQFRQAHSDAFEVLTRVKVTFEKVRPKTVRGEKGKFTPIYVFAYGS